MAVDLSSFKKLLIEDEGLKLKAYKDTLGVTTIGVGRNLDQVGISEEEAMMLLDNDIANVYKQAMVLPWFKYLSIKRQDVILSMIFNMGLAGVLEFKGMIRALIVADYEVAAEEMLDSKWAGQVRRRAKRLAAMMREG